MNSVECEICGKSLPLLEGYFSCPDMESGEWQLVCQECPDGFYDFEAKRFFKSPASTIDWLAHLQEKIWFKPKKFFDFMDRARANGKFYFQT